MRILILTQYFPPEIGATQARLEAFATGLAGRGHDVEVLCEVPNHPQGVIHPEFRRRLMVRSREGAYAVTRVWVHARPVKTKLSRVSFYASYCGLATAVGSARPRPDVILASSPPLPVAAAASLIAARHRAPWVMDVRDLWPDAAVAMGELSEGATLGAAKWLERRLYHSASAITAVTAPFVGAIRETAGRDTTVTLVPNGTSDFWLAVAQIPSCRQALGLADEEFVWMFAGNVGKAQGLEAALEAARMLGEGFRLLILGDGPARAALEERARSLAGVAVEFRDQVPPTIARQHIAAADALLVSLGSDPVLASFVPSKLFDFCATGKPTVLAAAGEPERLAATSGAALAVPPGDPEALAAAIRLLRNDPALRESLGAAGRRFAQDHLREDQIDELERVLAGAAEGRPR